MKILLYILWNTSVADLYFNYKRPNHRFKYQDSLFKYFKSKFVHFHLVLWQSQNTVQAALMQGPAAFFSSFLISLRAILTKIELTRECCKTCLLSEILMDLEQATTAWQDTSPHLNHVADHVHAPGWFHIEELFHCSCFYNEALQKVSMLLANPGQMINGKFLSHDNSAACDSLSSSLLLQLKVRCWTWKMFCAHSFFGSK